MKNRLWRLLTAVALCCAVVGVFAQEATPKSASRIQVMPTSPETEIGMDGDVISANNGVLVTYEDISITAGEVSVNTATGLVAAKNGVSLKQGGQVWMGDEITYNYLTKMAESSSFRTGAPPFLASGQMLVGDITNKIYSASSAVITTDDVKDPIFKIKAESLIVVPGVSIEAYNATVYLGGLPVFYYPHYKRQLGRHLSNFEFTPGYRSLYGPYMLNAWNWYANTNIQGSVNLDYRQKRGVGGGPDFQYDLKNFGVGELKLYVARDDRPGTNFLGAPIESRRNRISWDHRVQISTNFTMTGVLRHQSDEYFVRDFFETEHHENIQPSSFLELDKHWDNFSLNILAQPQVNDFFDTVERLPDVRFTAARQQLGKLPVFYESESSFGYFRRQIGHNLGAEYSAFRGDTFHQFVAPKTLFGFLNFTPRLGGRLTHYGESEGLGVAFTEHDRWVMNAGAEMSLKASRLWEGKQSKFWEMDGLRHIVRPSINYAWIPNPSPSPTALPQFDRTLPTFRLLPIEFPEFNAIDSIDGQNVFRFGLRNKLQTKRQGRVEDLLDWKLFMDWNLRPRTAQGGYSDIFSDLDFRPRSWLTMTSQTRYDVENGVFQLADHILTLEPNSIVSLSLGHRYFRSDPAFGAVSGNNLFNTVAYLRLNENWGLRTQHLFEARDGRLEEQYYSVYRDLRNWTAALTFRVRESRFGQDDFSVAFTFSLKAFPRYALGADKSHPSLLLE
ncbi:LPS assembly protein LptD [Verrucomicrobia bacterium]|nr:LPS assembly protein LptD [Verrucomicrobiota bacterium]MDB4458941.1 LPS assembly protein LptD [bacterium]